MVASETSADTPRHGRLFSVLRSLRNSSMPSQATPSEAQREPKKGTIQLYELINEIKVARNPQVQLASINILTKLLDDFALASITPVWSAATHLTRSPIPEIRTAVYELMIACIRSRIQLRELDRLQFFTAIEENPFKEDFEILLKALEVLTNDGHDISSFASHLPGLLSNWISTCYDLVDERRKFSHTGLSSTTGLPEITLHILIKLLTKIIKFNFALLDEKSLDLLVRNVIAVGKRTRNENDTKDCLVFIDALIRYGHVSKSLLRLIMEILCSAILHEIHVDTTWIILRNLLKSHMANNTLVVLREFLQSVRGEMHESSLRGAVKLISRVTLNEEFETPDVSVSGTLLALESVVIQSRVSVNLEVSVAIERLVKHTKAASQLSYSDWELVLRIIRLLSQHLSQLPSNLQQFPSQTDVTEDCDMNIQLCYALGSSISAVYQMIETGSFEGSQESFLDFLATIGRYLPPDLAIKVITYFEDDNLCLPSCPQWIQNVQKLVNTFYLSESVHHTVRIKVIDLLVAVYETASLMDDTNLIAPFVLIAISLIQAMQQEKDSVVFRHLLDFAVAVSAVDIETFEQVVTLLAECVYSFESQPLDKPSLSHRVSTKSVESGASGEKQDTQSFVYAQRLKVQAPATQGLVDIFKTHCRSCDGKRTLKVFDILVKISGMLGLPSELRAPVIAVLLQMRANSRHFIWISPYVEDIGVVHQDLPSWNNSPGRERSKTVSSDTQLQNTVHTFKQSLTSEDQEVKPNPLLISYIQQEVVFDDEDVIDPTSERLETLLPVDNWLQTVINILTWEKSGDIYFLVIRRLSSQLSSKHLFCGSKVQINSLQRLLCSQLLVDLPDLKLSAEIRQDHIISHLVQIISVLLSYHDLFQKSQEDDIVKAFETVLEKWKQSAKAAIHALYICCYELPLSMSKRMPAILSKLARMITSTPLSVHILEFLIGLARIPDIYVNFTEGDFRMLFGIAHQYIAHTNSSPSRTEGLANFLSGTVLTRSQSVKSNTPSRKPTAAQLSLSRYVFTLAYDVIATWFLAMRIPERQKHFASIVRGLLNSNTSSEKVDEQNQAILDLLEWFCFTDVELRTVNPDSYVTDALTKTWLYGNSLITVTSHGPSSSFDVVVRRPASTSRFTFKSVVKQGVTSGVSQTTHYSPPDNSLNGLPPANQPILPGFLIMQLLSRPSMLPNAKPVPLPDDDNTRRSISVFDRIPVVNFHKIGVLYVGKGQTTEQQILSNRVGSCEYMEFLKGLGNLVHLKDNKDIYTGGLDTEDDHDGAFAFFWSDKITQIIYHTCTLMPTDLGRDPHCTMKKRHIGNSFVNIIYNDSGIPYHFDTIPGQFNFINIIITPTSASTYLAKSEHVSFRVELQCRPELAEISPVYEFKMIHSPALPNFVRNIALNADIFAQAYHKEEYVTNWRERLIKINGIRERVSSVQPPGSPTWPATKASPNRKSCGENVTGGDVEGLMRFEQFFDLSHLL